MERTSNSSKQPLLTIIDQSNLDYLQGCRMLHTVSVVHDNVPLEHSTGMCLVRTLSLPQIGQLKFIPIVQCIIEMDEDDIPLPPSQSLLNQCRDAYITNIRSDSTYSDYETVNEYIIGEWDDNAPYCSLFVFACEQSQSLSVIISYVSVDIIINS